MRIEINLLPPSYFEAKKRQQMILLGIAGGILVVALFIGFNVMKFVQANNLKRQIAQVEEEQKKYETVLTELERIRQQKTQVEEREKLLDELLTRQARWPNFLVQFGRATPDSIYLMSLKNGGGADRLTFTVDGRALSKQAVADFLNSLVHKLPGVDASSVQQIVEQSPNPGNTSFLISFSMKL